MGESDETGNAWQVCMFPILTLSPLKSIWAPGPSPSPSPLVQSNPYYSPAKILLTEVIYNHLGKRCTCTKPSCTQVLCLFATVYRVALFTEDSIWTLRHCGNMIRRGMSHAREYRPGVTASESRVPHA
ncbi:hypothetical protein GYMLUDRAFT_319894 [Collybiopsis luxurians FD-317 M1]|nr:hypothetical protein GYMLUDRAFT_319894 [Collybiopsis luxurians FD-317 M1]